MVEYLVAVGHYEGSSYKPIGVVVRDGDRMEIRTFDFSALNSFDDSETCRISADDIARMIDENDGRIGFTEFKGDIGGGSLSERADRLFSMAVKDYYFL